MKTKYTFFSLFVFFLPISLLFAQETTQGFEECKQGCMIQECGEANLKCPTISQQRQYKSLCHGRCVEKMRRQDEERKLRAFRRAVQLERERSARFFKLIQMRHKMEIEKKSLWHRLEIAYEDAKRKRETSKVNMYMKKMQLAHDQRLQIVRESYQYKVRFYKARMALRSKQKVEFQRQVQKLQKEKEEAKAKNDMAKMEQLEKLAKLRQEQASQMHKKEASLNVKVHENKVKEQKQVLVQIQSKQEQINKEKLVAQQKQDKERLRELALKLGNLAGQQAATNRQVKIEEQKLESAKVSYSSNFQ